MLKMKKKAESPCQSHAGKFCLPSNPKLKLLYSSNLAADKHKLVNSQPKSCQMSQSRLQGLRAYT